MNNSKELRETLNYIGITFRTIILFLLIQHLNYIYILLRLFIPNFVKTK